MASKPRALFRTVSQHAKRDCMVSCLSSILDVPYEEVLVVAATVQPNILVGGMHDETAIEVARRFERTLVEAPVNYRTDVGILGVTFPNGLSHGIVLSHGLVYDPEDQTVWKAKQYLKRFRAKVDNFLELED